MQVIQTIGGAVSSSLGLGLGSESLHWHHVVLRGAVVYASGVAMVRLAPRRFMGRHTTFDLILGIILGALLARAINGGAPLVPTLAGGFGLVFLDRVFAAGAHQWSWFRKLVEGTGLPLVRNGRVLNENLDRSYLSMEDLEAALRTRGGVIDPEEVEEARIEQSGEISVVARGR